MTGESGINALKIAYRKHCIGDETIGWQELEEVLFDALCNELGNDEFTRWSESAKNQAEQSLKG